MIYTLKCINNHVISSISYMLSSTRARERFGVVHTLAYITILTLDDGNSFEASCLWGFLSKDMA